MFRIQTRRTWSVRVSWVAWPLETVIYRTVGEHVKSNVPERTFNLHTLGGTCF